MEIDDYKELDEFLEQELIFKDEKLVTKLTKHDLMRLMQHWKNKKLNKPQVMQRSEQLTAFENWLKENYNAFKIPQNIKEDYISCS